MASQWGGNFSLLLALKFHLMKILASWICDFFVFFPLPLFLVYHIESTCKNLQQKGQMVQSKESSIFGESVKCTKQKLQSLISAQLLIQLYIFHWVSGWIWILNTKFLGFAFFLYCCNTCAHLCFFNATIYKHLFILKESLHSFERHELPRVLLLFTFTILL